MPAEIEVPTEHLHETIHEEHHKSGHGHGPEQGHGADKGNFTLGVALSSAVLAVLAALAALFAGHHANEAMLERVEASDKWSYYQAKGIKANLLATKMELLSALERPANPEEKAKYDSYKQEQKDIETEAREKEESSEKHMAQHVVLARSVTFFQVAIAMGAIAVLTKRRGLWLVSLAVGVGGAFFLVQGLREPTLPPHAVKAEHTSGSSHHESGPAPAEHH